MGIVTDHLVKLIQRQVEDKGLVLWCDPDRTYAGLAPSVISRALPDTRLARFTGAYLALRREIDDALNDVDADSPSRLVVYHPAPSAAADRALDELVTGGIVMQPGGQSLPLNTKLEVVARHALKTKKGEVGALDLPRPHLRGYPRETVVAEKVHAMVTLGAINSRMKDFYD